MSMLERIQEEQTHSPRKSTLSRSGTLGMSQFNQMQGFSAAIGLPSLQNFGPKSANASPTTRRGQSQIFDSSTAAIGLGATPKSQFQSSPHKEPFSQSQHGVHPHHPAAPPLTTIDETETQPKPTAAANLEKQSKVNAIYDKLQDRLKLRKKHGDVNFRKMMAEFKGLDTFVDTRQQIQGMNIAFQKGFKSSLEVLKIRDKIEKLNQELKDTQTKYQSQFIFDTSSRDTELLHQALKSATKNVKDLLKKSKKRLTEANQQQQPSNNNPNNENSKIHPNMQVNNNNNNRNESTQVITDSLKDYMRRLMPFAAPIEVKDDGNDFYNKLEKVFQHQSNMIQLQEQHDELERRKQEEKESQLRDLLKQSKYDLNSGTSDDANVPNQGYFEEFHKQTQRTINKAIRESKKIYRQKLGLISQKQKLFIHIQENIIDKGLGGGGAPSSLGTDSIESPLQLQQQQHYHPQQQQQQQQQSHYEQNPSQRLIHLQQTQSQQSKHQQQQQQHQQESNQNQQNNFMQKTGTSFYASPRRPSHLEANTLNQNSNSNSNVSIKPFFSQHQQQQQQLHHPHKPTTTTTNHPQGNSEYSDEREPTSAHSMHRYSTENHLQIQNATASSQHSARLLTSVQSSKHLQRPQGSTAQSHSLSTKNHHTSPPGSRGHTENNQQQVPPIKLKPTTHISQLSKSQVQMSRTQTEKFPKKSNISEFPVAHQESPMISIHQKTRNAMTTNRLSSNPAQSNMSTTSTRFNFNRTAEQNNNNNNNMQQNSSRTARQFFSPPSTTSTSTLPGIPQLESGSSSQLILPDEQQQLNRKKSFVTISEEVKRVVQEFTQRSPKRQQSMMSNTNLMLSTSSFNRWTSVGGPNSERRGGNDMQYLNNQQDSMKSFLNSMKQAEGAYKDEKQEIIAALADAKSQFVKTSEKYDEPKISSIREVQHNDEHQFKTFLRRVYKPKSMQVSNY